jgi:microsomal epoxide hydrolase
VDASPTSARRFSKGTAMSIRRALLLSCAIALPLDPVLAGQSAASLQGEVDVGDGVRIHYLAAGDPSAKRAVVLVPGWSTSSAIWRDQMPALAALGRVVAIDPRSQGDSTVTTRGNTPEQRARDLRAVLRALEIDDAVLVGWSQGVQDVAAYAAAFGGDGVSGYVLVDAAVAAGAGAWSARPEALREQLERLATYVEHPREYLQGMLETIIRSPGGRERIPELVETGLRTPPDLGASMLLMDFIAYDRRPALQRFDRPTLVLAAADSEELAEQRAMARAIPGARLEVVENAGHALFLDQPERFRELLAAFVERTARGPKETLSGKTTARARSSRGPRSAT